MFCKFFVAFIIFYIKPTCFKKHLHRRQGQSGFHFLVFILNNEREVQFFIFWGTIAQIFGAKKDGFCTIPHYFWVLPYSSWRVLRLYVGGVMSFIISPVIAAERPWRNSYISIAINDRLRLFTGIWSWQNLHLYISCSLIRIRISKFIFYRKISILYYLTDPVTTRSGSLKPPFKIAAVNLSRKLSNFFDRINF